MKPHQSSLMLLGLTASLLCASPRAVADDGRVRTLTYDAEAVWSLPIRPGRAVQILLPEGERFQQVVLGDGEGWLAQVEGGVLFLRADPQAQPTNLLWVSQSQAGQRTYRADIAVTNGSPALYEVRFEAKPARKPDEPSEDPQATIESLLAQAPFIGARNFAYEAAGEPALQPSEAFDNGRFTVLRFGELQPLPAVYSVAPDGQEQLVRFDVRGPYVVLYGAYAQLRLRRGSARLCLFNRGYGSPKLDQAAGPDQPVERIRRDQASQ